MKSMKKMVVWSLGILVIGVLVLVVFVLNNQKQANKSSLDLGTAIPNEDAKAKDTNAKDTNAKDTNAKDTNAKDTNAKDTNAKDTNAKDTNAKDAKANVANAEATNSNNPNAERLRQDDTKNSLNQSEKNFLGAWEIVSRIKTSNVSAIGEDEEKALLGQTIIYGEEIVFADGIRTVRKPFYKVYELTKEEFALNYKGATFEQLGMKTKTVTKVEIYQDVNLTQNTFSTASNFMIRDENTLILIVEGGFFELKKAKRSAYSTLEEIQELLGKGKAFIQSQYNGQYVITPGFDGVEAYYFKEKGINLYFNNEIVDMVQILHPLVEVMGTSLISDEQDLIEKNSGFESTMGRNEMTTFRYITYEIEDERVQYDIDGNGDVIGIWVSKKKPVNF